MLSHAYTKRRLLKELAYKVGIRQELSQKILDALVEIAYREAANEGFVLPGLCKFEVVDRKARKIRNPRTGETLVMPPHKALKATLSSLAKRAVAPKPRAVPESGYVPPTPAEPATKPAEPAPQVAEPAPQVAEPAVERAAAPESICFRCPHCNQEIEAPGNAAGAEAECPLCGSIVLVPTRNEDGTCGKSEIVSVKEAEKMDPELLKHMTIRISAEELGLDEVTKPAEEPQMVSFFCSACHQEIEASPDMCGTQTECPNCGSPLTVPMFSQGQEATRDSEDPALKEALKNRTMRIDINDF